MHILLLLCVLGKAISNDHYLQEKYYCVNNGLNWNQTYTFQQFSATFEAAIDGVPQNQAKGRNLTFEVAGEGNLPRISIMKPSVRNKKGQPLLLFRRNLIGRSQPLPLVIINDGTLPSKVDIDMVDPDGVFTLVPTGSTRAVMAQQDPQADG